jgi:hypothetical protein
MARKRMMAVGCPTTLFIGRDSDSLEHEGFFPRGLRRAVYLCIKRERVVQLRK